MAAVQPNNGHLAVAAWQDYADVHVVTQNVDNLHERAGSKHVYHLHGSLFEFRCDCCQHEYRGKLPEMPEPLESVDPPRHSCGGTIRPNVVWFGEPLPDEAWQRSVEAVTAADVAIVVGTSSIVYPAAGLPELALANGTVVIEVNPERTPLSDAATVSLRETAAGALPGLLQRLPALLG
jgi:NAD-dependent deacetylase